MPPSAWAIEVALATDRCTTLEDPWRDRAVPIRFDDEPGSLAAILHEAARSPFAGLLAVGDRPVAIAAHAAAALGLPYHPIDGARAAHNKRLSRERLRAAGLPVPWFASYAIDDPRPLGAGEVPFPCVIKPLVLSGSRGVIRADSRAELAAAHARVAALLHSREVQALRDPDAGAVLIEGYIPGDEYAIEGLLEHGRLRVLAIFDKPDPLQGPFFEETIYVTPSRGDCSAGSAASSTPSRRLRTRWVCTTDRFTPSAGSMATACSCWKWPLGRSAGCVPGRCGSRTAACGSRSRNCCCATPSGNRPCRGRAKRRRRGS